ncbi:MAG: hypothetical protein J3R72DRAFT_158248 [Linnemannia gamsii]|nr:MAG: hypothetical protein J3R72DRAFT_158248 [Linnemannia gamsii]
MPRKKTKKTHCHHFLLLPLSQTIGCFVFVHYSFLLLLYFHSFLHHLLTCHSQAAPKKGDKSKKKKKKKRASLSCIIPSPPGGQNGLQGEEKTSKGGKNLHYQQWNKILTNALLLQPTAERRWRDGEMASATQRKVQEYVVCKVDYGSSALSGWRKVPIRSKMEVARTTDSR